MLRAASRTVILAEEYPDTIWPYVSYALAETVGVARIVQDAHWAFDVLAGPLLCLAVGRTLVWLHRQAEFPPLAPWARMQGRESTIGLSLALLR